MSPQSIARFSSSFLVHVIDPALRSLVLGALAAALLYVFRVKSPAMRLTVWTGVLYAAFAMPFLALAVPSLPFPLPSALSSLLPKTSAVSAVATPPPHSLTSPVFAATLSEAPAAARENAVSESDAAPRIRRYESQPANPLISEHAFQLKREVAATPPSSEGISSPVTAAALTANLSAPASAQPAVRRVSPLSVLAVFFFGIVALFMLARIALGAIFGHRLVRSAETIGDRDAIRILFRQASAAGVASAPRLAESDLVSVPITLGVARPVILLPSYWSNWDDRTLSAVIAHEMAHVARRDALTQRLALIHRAIFWFSPLSWWLTRSLSNAAEEASDEAALEIVSDRAFYAETVIEFFAALAEHPRRVYWQGVSMAAPGQAERRVDRILNWKGAVSMRITKSLAVGLAVFGIPMVLLTASARPSATQVAITAPQLAPPALPALPALPAMPAANPLPALGSLAAPSLPPTPEAIPPVLTQVTPDVPPAPAAPAQVPGTPNEPAAPSLAPPTPLAPGTVITPRVIVGNRALELQVQRQADINAQIKGLKNLAEKDVAQADKQLKFTLKAMPQLSAEDQKKLQDLEQKLAELRDQYTQNHPDVQKLEEQIAQLEAQAKSMSAQFQPLVSNAFNFDYQGQPFQFQVGPAAKISIGDFGDRFVIVSGDSPIIMSGNSQDVEHATALRSKISGDFIWFQHDEKSYVIRDQALVNQAKAFFKPEQDLSDQQRALGDQQRALGDQQRDMGQKMRDAKVNPPDLSADMEKLETQMKQFSASGATPQQVGDLQRQLGELQRRLGQSESQVGDQERQVGDQMRALGDKQRDLGNQQRDLGQKQRDAANQARTQMKQLLDDAISKGTAQPE